MREKAVSGIMLILLFLGLLPLTFHIQQANAPAEVQVAIVNPVAIFPWPNWTTTEAFKEWILPINVTIQNLGTVYEDVQVAASYSNDNGTAWIQIGTNQSIIDIPPGGNGTILTFQWDLKTAGLSPAIYPVKVDAYATNATLGLSASDQQILNIKVRVLGDVDGDNDVDVSDERKQLLAMFESYPGPVYLQYNSFPIFTDMDGDGDIDVGDNRKLELQYFMTFPGPLGGAGISPYSPASSIALDPLTATVQAGQTLTVTVSITNITDCAGFQLCIDYDPSILYFPYSGYTFDTGTPLTPTQVAPAPGDRVDLNPSVSGTVQIATVWKAGVPRYSYAGNSTAAEITFQALTTGSVRFALDPVWTHVTDNLGDDILFKNLVLRIGSDVDGDRDVDVGDQRKVQLAMFTTPESPNWDPNMDVDGDLDVDVGDQRIQQLHMFESW